MRRDSLDSYVSAGERLLDAARRNPEALLLLAAGGALLLRHGADLYPFGGESDDAPKQRSGKKQTSGKGAGRASGQKRRSGFADATDKATDYAAEVAEYASDLGNQAYDTIRSYGSSASRLGERTLEQQPFAIAALGLAAGAAVAALLPSTTIERRNLRGVRETVDEMVSAGADKLTEAASDAGRRMQQRAKQAATDVAWDAAKTFTSGLTNKEEEPDGERNA